MATWNPGKFLREVRSETGKIAWPTRRETVMTGLMVAIMTSVLGVFFFSVDSLFHLLVRSLIGLVS